MIQNTPNEGRIGIKWLAARWAISQWVEIDRQTTGKIVFGWIIWAIRVVRVWYHWRHSWRRRRLGHDEKSRILRQRGGRASVKQPRRVMSLVVQNSQGRCARASSSNTMVWLLADDLDDSVEKTGNDERHGWRSLDGAFELSVFALCVQVEQNLHPSKHKLRANIAMDQRGPSFWGSQKALFLPTFSSLFRYCCLDLCLWPPPAFFSNILHVLLLQRCWASAILVQALFTTRSSCMLPWIHFLLSS